MADLALLSLRRAGMGCFCSQYGFGERASRAVESRFGDGMIERQNPGKPERVQALQAGSAKGGILGQAAGAPNRR